MSRVYNFSAGPAVLPEEVLKEAAAEMLDYNGTGMSVMEMSHRSKAFQKIIDDAEQDLRDLMKIPDNYKVLFLQGGASQQFAMIPMNLMKNRVADYIVTGQWAKKAYQEAQKFGKANKIASSEDKTFSYIPDCSDLPISEDADYVYICENNTIYGTKFKTCSHALDGCRAFRKIYTDRGKARNGKNTSDQGAYGIYQASACRRFRLRTGKASTCVKRADAACRGAGVCASDKWRIHGIPSAFTFGIPKFT